MSRSPERMSSYRRRFEGTDVSTFSCHLRASSPSPTRRETRHRSASFTRGGGWKMMGQRALTTKSCLSSSVSMGALCLGVSTGIGANLDLDVAAAENQAFKLTRTNERQEMVVLNDRLAVYIEKVRTLESKNKLLEAEIEALKDSYDRTSGLRQLYASQLKELKRDSEQMREQRDLSLAAKEVIVGQLDMLKVKYDEALEARKQTELDIEALRPDVDKATSGRIKLEKQLENLEVEQTFLQRVHKEEIEELMQQIYLAASKTDLTFGLPDLSSALTQIQSQYDSIAAKNLQEMDDWYRTKFQDLNDASTKHVQSVRSMREEIARYRKDILNKERDLESLKTRNEYLEAYIHDVAEKYKMEEEDLQEHSEALNVDLKLTKEKTALLMREYQELLNAKMALEIEITTYRKLIEGEDSRLSSMVRNLSLTGGPHLPSCEFASSLSASDSSGTLELDKGPSETDENMTKKVPAAGSLEVVSLETYTDGNSEQQASEMSERKTVLVRTVKTDEDTYVSNTQQCTITISGAAEETDEE
ncbi:notochord granular surface [Melanotaenia boesemani]|uniref:notochord granular surface n=1 Tax=Melanotaenia boesemani TaxID=1250792 RepID=UPI001C03EB5F|nr:notochord granular surface [Melanotaenia boesemani]